MSIFGTVIEVNLSLLAHPTCLEERLVNVVLKKNEERNVFIKFIRSKASDEFTFFEDMEKKAQDLFSDIRLVKQEEVINFIISELKVQTNGSPSVYESLVAELISLQNPAAAKAHEHFRTGKIKADELPRTYPGLRKRAEGLLLAKIKDMSGADQVNIVLERKRIESIVRKMSRELIFAVNNGLSEEQTLKYLRTIYKLHDVSLREPDNEKSLKEALIKAIKDGVAIEMINLKCLRFSYPLGKNLELITDMGDHQIADRLGAVFTLPSEKEYFVRLEKVFRIFEKNQIPFKRHIVIMDLDLDDHFPKKVRGYIPRRDLAKAKHDLRVYVNCLMKKAPFGTEVTTLSDFLKRKELMKKYLELREAVLDDLSRGGQKFVAEKTREERVNYRHEANMKIFGKSDRASARTRADLQLGSLIALRIFAGENRIMVSEDRGAENALLLGKEQNLPVIYVQLRDGV